MKRSIAVILALLTLLSVSTVCAAAPVKTEKAEAAKAETTVTEPSEKTSEESVRDAEEAGTTVASVIARRGDVEKKSIYTDRESIPRTADTVTIDEENSAFTVVTASGTELSITVPFGAYCITQDIAQQLDIYLSLFADVGTTLKNYVSRGIHMDLYDFYTGKSVYITETSDTFAAMMGNLNKLNRTSRKQVADYMSKYWFDNHPAKLKTVGKNTYIVFDLAQDCGFVMYNTIVEGKLVEVYTICDNGKEGMEQIDRMIQELTFGERVPAAEEEPVTEPAETLPEETQTAETLPEASQPEETKAE